jgi:hypothetical protein
MADAQNPVYMTSVTLPLAILRRLADAGSTIARG